MNIGLIAVILAIMSYAFSKLEIENDIIIILLVFVLLFDSIGFEEVLLDLTN